MPKIHTEPPSQQHGHYGEFKVYEYLSQLNNSNLELWFNLELPGVPELDLLLYHQVSGLFLIEIKSYEVDDIKDINAGQIVLNDRGRKTDTLSLVQTPIKQVRTAQIQLMNYLKNFEKNPQNKSFPFIQTSILFSRITKEKFTKRFSSKSNLDFVNKVLFLDDIVSDYSLDWKLEKLRDNPLLGIYPEIKREHEQKIDFVRQALENRVIFELNNAKKAEIAKSVSFSSNHASKFPYDKTTKVHIFQGAPGTGKTTILREIAVNHSKEGAAVLYLCFQKVLAAEMRREMAFLKIRNEKKGFIDVLDLWDFLKRYNGKIGLGMEWGEILDHLLDSDEFRNLEYDTVLIDESQDLPIVAFEMLKYIVKNTASVYVSYGPGQELFHMGNEVSPAPWLKKFLEIDKCRTTLRRSFRNSALPFRLAQSFWENALDLVKNKEWIDSKFSQEPTPELLLPIEFEPPYSKNDVLIEFTPNKEIGTSVLKRILHDETQNLKKRGLENDLLILVGSNSLRNSKEVLINCLTDLKLNFKDLTINENKRIPTDLIRIVTHVNSRGLTASTVIILDFEEIHNWVESKKLSDDKFRVTVNNLGYICLSRAKNKTIILLNNEFQNLATNFVTTSYFNLVEYMDYQN